MSYFDPHARTRDIEAQLDLPEVMKEETEFMQSILPDHYMCEPRKNGVHCYSSTGIDETDPEHWDYIFKAIKQGFGSRFMEVYHQTSANHTKFTVFIQP